MNLGCLCSWYSVLMSLSDAGWEFFLAVTFCIVLSTNPALLLLCGATKGVELGEDLSFVLAVWILLLGSGLVTWAQYGGSPVSYKWDLEYLYLLHLLSNPLALWGHSWAVKELYSLYIICCSLHVPEEIRHTIPEHPKKMLKSNIRLCWRTISSGSLNNSACPLKSQFVSRMRIVQIESSNRKANPPKIILFLFCEETILPHNQLMRSYLSSRSLQLVPHRGQLQSRSDTERERFNLCSNSLCKALK